MERVGNVGRLPKDRCVNVGMLSICCAEASSLTYAALCEQRWVFRSRSRCGCRRARLQPHKRIPRCSTCPSMLCCTTRCTARPSGNDRARLPWRGCLEPRCRCVWVCVPSRAARGWCKQRGAHTTWLRGREGEHLVEVDRCAVLGWKKRMFMPGCWCARARERGVVGTMWLIKHRLVGTQELDERFEREGNAWTPSDLAFVISHELAHIKCDHLLVRA